MKNEKFAAAKFGWNGTFCGKWGVAALFCGLLACGSQNSDYICAFLLFYVIEKR
ncbi:MAG: hypothetical protein IJV33_11495 [Bacteroidaceae bacterium]|nr:hypothetical protein [Bacteroidaceae bacterium]